MPRKQPDPDLEQLWRDRLARWRDSALSVRLFCARESLRESAFSFWRAELQRRDHARPAAVPFVPVRVAAPPVPPPAVPLELVTAVGTLRIAPGCDRVLLRAVFAAFGGAVVLARIAHRGETRRASRGI